MNLLVYQPTHITTPTKEKLFEILSNISFVFGHRSESDEACFHPLPPQRSVARLPQSPRDAANREQARLSADTAKLMSLGHWRVST